MRGARGETLRLNIETRAWGKSEIMISESPLPSRKEFHRRSPDNVLLVENDADGGVVIRAAVDNYSEERKALFIRELVSEGFIPDRFRFVESKGEDKLSGVRWMIDNSWLIVAPETILVSWRGVWGMYLDACMGAASTVDWRSYRHWC